MPASQRSGLRPKTHDEPGSAYLSALGGVGLLLVAAGLIAAVPIFGHGFGHGSPPGGVDPLTRETLSLVAYPAWDDDHPQPDQDPRPDAESEPRPEPDPVPEPPPEPPRPPHQPAPVVEPGPGELVIVKLLTGRSLSGILLESSPAGIAVDVNGLRVSLVRADIAAIEHKPTRYDEYARLRAAIPNDDVPGTVTLVRWLLEQELFDEALAEAEALVEVRIGDTDATRLFRETQATVRLRQREAREAERGGGAGRQIERLAGEIELVRFGPSEFPVLSRDQINLIKVFEVDVSNPPRLRITHDTINRLFTEYGEHPLVPESRRARDAFRRKPAHEILDVMFRVQARSLYGDVQVIGQPHAMERFRDDVHGRWLINSCASTRCHGGKGAGRFVLRNIRRSTEETFYTNFLVVDRYRTAQGLPLINWSDPPRSPLFHYALPRDDALFPHPLVEGWTPVIRSRSHRNFRDSVDWVRSMYLPRPDYAIEYESPTDLAERLAREGTEREPGRPDHGPQTPRPER